MQHIFLSTLPIFLITLLGSIVKRKWLTSDEFWRGLEKLSYFILFPALLFNYTSTIDFSAKSLGKLITGLIISTIIVTIGLILYRKKTNGDVIQFTSVYQGSVRYNSYILFSLGGALFGNEGLAMVSVISSYMIIFTIFLSVIIFANYIPSDNPTKNKQKNLWLLLKLIVSNPLIISSIGGICFNYLGFELNLGVKNSLSSLGNSALAIGMLNVGASLKFIIDLPHLRQVLFSSLVKLIIFPLITVGILNMMSISGIEKSVGILYSCLPSASSAFVLSRQLGGDPESMASIITVQTVLSLLSLSALMYILT